MAVRFALFASLLLAGCAAKPGPPVIERVALPAEVAPGADGTYKVYADIVYHDDDDVLASVRFTVPVDGKPYEVTIPSAERMLRGTIGATIGFPASSAKGAVAFAITLIDESGLESVPSIQMVTLK